MTMLLALLLACGSTPKDTSPPGDSVPTGDSTPVDDTSTPSGPDYCAVKAIFTAQCNVCHSASGRLGGLDLETDPRAALVNVASAAYPGRTLVIPSNAVGSFLVVKVEDNQDPGEGTRMPPSSALGAADVATIRGWIDAGATDACGPDTGHDTDTGVGAYHPVGFADPAQHGMDAKYQRDACTTCHGTDLTGGAVGVSCDTCHSAGWRTDCVFCHGGSANPTGAPPRDIDNQDTSLSFDPHTQHVTQGDHPAYGCETCHVRPVDVTSVGHFLVKDATPGLAEVTMSAGLSPSGTYAAGTCSNLYCHGNGQTSNGTVSATASVSCGSCHGVYGTGESSWERLSGEHHKHVNDVRLTCDTCHGAVVGSSDNVVGPDLHVDGAVSVVLPTGMSYDSARCTGTCHGRSHSSERW